MYSTHALPMVMPSMAHVKMTGWCPDAVQVRARGPPTPTLALPALPPPTIRAPSEHGANGDK